MGSMFGNFGELASLLGKAKEIQASIKKLKSELPEMEFDGTSASGKVKAVVSGDFQLRRLEAVACNLNEASAAEIAEAVNAALAQAKQFVAQKMKESAGGIDLPAMF